MNDRWTRRRALAGLGTAAVAGLAGCTSLTGDDGTDGPGVIGTPFEDREPQGGTPMAELPPLSGTIDVYSGRGEPLVGDLFSYMEELYADRDPPLDIRTRYDPSTRLVNRILEEGENSAADVFFSVNAGALGKLADEDRAVGLPDDVLSMIPEQYRDPDGQWVGTSGRARTIPYNTETFSGDDIPDDIFAFPDAERFDGRMGWAPSYGSFQAFVTAMRLLNGREETKAWLEGMLDSEVRSYNDEFTIAQRIADGEIQAGFTNHYYIQRVLAGRPNAPLATAFTTNDAGAIFNVAGATVVDTTDDEGQATTFVRHLLSAEAQDYFARTTFEYPLVPEVEPIGRLPSIDELNPPEGLDLSELSNLEPTIDLLREVGISV